MAVSFPSSSFDFSSSFSASERLDIAKTVSPANSSTPYLWDAASNLNLPIEQLYGPDAPDLGAALGLDYTQFLGGLAGSASPGWTFITAPEDVSWDIANQANRVDIFGTNNPPVVAGSRGMRDLTLGNALVEGFVRGKQVEYKVQALEKLLNYGLNTSDGFVSVPVYQVWANSKSYGGPDAYYIIKDVRVKETMRDLTGNSTRAYVDISLMQVPAYQVNSGRDLASATTAGAKSGLLSDVKSANNASSSTAAQGAVDKQLNGKGVAGATASQAAAKPSSSKVVPLDPAKGTAIAPPSR